MDREEVLNHLIHFNLPLNDIQYQLMKYEWDSEPLVILKKDDLKLILKKYVEGLISNNALEEWANIIESREDVGYTPSESRLIKEIIFILANPDISMKLTKNNVCKLIEKLS